MPTERILVERLDPSLTWDGINSWHVTGTYLDGRSGVFQASTLSAWAASLIDLAWKAKQPISLIWKDGVARSKYIVDVQREVA